MDPKDLDDPHNRRPSAAPEGKRTNVRRQVPVQPGADGSSEENAYTIDPEEEPAHAPDEKRTGAIADRARGERAFFDRHDSNPDEDLIDEDDPLTREVAAADDEVEIRHKRG